MTKKKDDAYVYWIPGPGSPQLRTPVTDARVTEIPRPSETSTVVSRRSDAQNCNSALLIARAAGRLAPAEEIRTDLE